jgi:capsular polysaccharide biosynthesis protein
MFDHAPTGSNETLGYSIATLADHTLLPNGFLLDADQKPVIYRGSSTPSPISRKKRRLIFKYRTLWRPDPIQMDRVTWVCRPNSDNYSHWLKQTLAKLYFLKSIGWSEPIVVSNKFLKMSWARETIRLFPDQNFILVSDDQEIRARSVFIVDEHTSDPDAANGIVLRRMSEFLLASVRAELPDTDFKRIHISRQKTTEKSQISARFAMC